LVDINAAGTTAGPLTNGVSAIDGGTPDPTVRDVAFTRTFETTNVSVPAAAKASVGVVPLKLMVDPLTVPRNEVDVPAVLFVTVTVASVYPVFATMFRLVTGSAGDKKS
jgi:hypothetical protein